MTTQQKQTQPLLPAYLIVGEDALKRDVVIKRLRKRIAQSGDLEFNHQAFDGESALGLDITSACDTMPFMSDMRLVEVTNADKMKKADADAVVAYLKNPSTSTVLALIADKLAKNTRLYKAVAAVGKQSVIECAPKARKDLPKMVRDLAISHGVVFNDRAARKLIELVGENSVALDGQIRKIALAHSGKDPVTDREVESLVARTAEAKPWEFVDAVSSRNLNAALRLLAQLDSSSPYALIGMCTRRIRELICAKSLEARGQGAQLAKVLKMPDWRVKNHRAWARSYTSEELRGALRLARDTELAMKSGADPDEAFMKWVLDTVPKKPSDRSIGALPRI